MKNKPHILLVDGLWALAWSHRLASKTNYEWPFSDADEWCSKRNLKEGRV